MASVRHRNLTDNNFCDTNSNNNNNDNNDNNVNLLTVFSFSHINPVSKRYQDLIEQIASPNSDQVVSSIEHATLSYNARPRYVIDSNNFHASLGFLHV